MWSPGALYKTKMLKDPRNVSTRKQPSEHPSAVDSDQSLLKVPDQIGICDHLRITASSFVGPQTIRLCINLSLSLLAMLLDGGISARPSCN